MPATEFIVRGRVQGVGFRYFVLRLANDLDVDGEVWNRRDGGVEIIAGSSDQRVLQAFEEGLRDGPGRVDDVTVFPHSFPVLQGFRITDTR